MERLPLLIVSTQQSRDIIASRAEQLLRPPATSPAHEDSEDEISCTPAFGSSNLRWETGHQVGVVSSKEGVAPSNEGVAPSNEGVVSSSEDVAPSNEGVASSNEGVVPSKAEDDLLFAWEDEDEIAVDSGSRFATKMASSSESECADSSQTCQVPAGGGHGTAGLCAEVVGLLKASFAEELEGVAYPTLWELGACELGSSSDLTSFYVSALSSMLSPSKVSDYYTLHSGMRLYLCSRTTRSPASSAMPILA